MQFRCVDFEYLRKFLRIRGNGADTHSGGEDFDNILMEKFAADFKHKHKMREIQGHCVDCAPYVKL